jgi:hypothetical protein
VLVEPSLLGVVLPSTVGFSDGVIAWWIGMSGIGLFNIALWLYLFKRLPSQLGETTGSLPRYRRLQWIFSGVFVFGCASRSFIIRDDGGRLSMIDSWIGSVMVGRSVATVAELCFVIQWALLLALLSKRTGVRAASVFANVIVPLIVIAEVASWYGVVTTNNLGHAIEESIWAFCAFLFILGLGLCYRKVEPPVRRFITLGIGVGVAYLVFMLTVDVPTYFARWRADEASGYTYLTITEGLQDVQRVVVTGQWEAWQYDMVWQTPYFSLAVWISLVLIFLPKLDS